MKSIPTYSLDQFKNLDHSNKPYQCEVFDANRHFEVTYPHRHDFFEVLFILNGSGEHIIDDQNYLVQPPCIFFLSPGQAHNLDLSKDVKGYIFLFAQEFYLLSKTNKKKLLELPFFFNYEKENAPLKIEEPLDLDFFTHLFKEGSRLMSENKDDPETIHSLLDLILNNAQRLYPEQEEKKLNSSGHLMVKRYRQLIAENYQKNLRVQEYAEMLNVTPNHLTHTVKKYTGQTSLQLLNNRNILEIKRMLIYTELTITEIADFLNYTDQSHLTKFFKKITGITPKGFKNS